MTAGKKSCSYVCNIPLSHIKSSYINKLLAGHSLLGTKRIFYFFLNEQCLRIVVKKVQT